MLRRFKISPHGPEVSSLAYGLWRLADDEVGCSTNRVRQKIDAALECGITTFDHADIYGGYRCEGIFGKALAESPELRDRMEIVTKCGINAPCDNRPGTVVKHYDVTASQIRFCVERSLKELSTDRIDVLLIHRPDWLTGAEETAEGLQCMIQQGKVRSVGVSNYNTHQSALLAKYLGYPPVTNQVEINLLRWEAIIDRTLDQCRFHDCHPMAWSPLAGGRLTSKEQAGPALWAKLTEIGQEHSASQDQIALAWVAALPSQPQIVIGTNQPERIRSSAAAMKIALSRQQWYALWQAAQGQPVP